MDYVHLDRNKIICNLKLRNSFLQNDILNKVTIHDFLYAMMPPLREIAHYFSSDYTILPGTFIGNIKFSEKNGDKTDYLHYSTNSSFALPHHIAVGGEVNGKVYLISENILSPGGQLSTIIIPDSKLFDHKVASFIPKASRSYLYDFSDEADISDEVVDCINYAVESADRIGKALKKVM